MKPRVLIITMSNAAERGGNGVLLDIARHRGHHTPSQAGYQAAVTHRDIHGEGTTHTEIWGLNTRGYCGCGYRVTRLRISWVSDGYTRRCWAGREQPGEAATRATDDKGQRM